MIKLLPNKKSIWVISDQLVRSATSIGANIIEAQASSSRREFKRYLEISLRSSNETKYWLDLLEKTEKQDMPNIEWEIKEATQISKILASSIIKLKKGMSE